jgi:hypothetical protein
MKNILLMLLLVNILFFVWGTTVVEESQPGVDVVAESDLGPPLDVTAGRDRDTVASVGAVLGSGEPSALQAVVGRSCATIGPFIDIEDADSALLEYSNEGMRTAMRAAQGEIFVGHWVQIRNIADYEVANAALDQLSASGLDEAYLVSTEDEGLKISVGVFADVDRAEKAELQARSLDLPAEISQRTRKGEVFFVDIGLPHGKGAGAMIERYGQDRVLLRGAATCPQ